MFQYRWEWMLGASPESLWPLVSDTNRFNYDTGLARVEPIRSAENGDGGPGRRLLRKVGTSVPIAWEEEPFDWVEPERYAIHRRYFEGPFKEIWIGLTMTAAAVGGTHLVYEMRAQPKGLLGYAAIAWSLGHRGGKSFDRVMRAYDRLAQAGSLSWDVPSSVKLAEGGAERLARAREALTSSGVGPDIVERLLQVVASADDIAVSRLRPYALADHWGVPRRRVLEACLYATRAGLLDLQWEVLCPFCRVAKQRDETLGELASTVHCETCNIDFSVQFDRSVELTFRANAAVRAAQGDLFCVGSPGYTPHVVAQQVLRPGEGRELVVALAEGHYRFRLLGSTRACLIEVTSDGDAGVDLRIDEGGLVEEALAAGRKIDLRVRNDSAREQVLLLERTRWSDQAATALEVASLQLFRDLFAREALRAGEQMGVGSVAILFTDLRNSTRMYDEIGDAPAFGRVMTHFDVLRQVIDQHEGAIVKTIGDAVMASFSQPANAVRALLEAQEQLARGPATAGPLMLKGGVHVGPCIAVTLNDRLDYFGSVVNLAARLEGLSSGEDVVVSEAVANDPAVRKALEAEGWAAEPFATEVRGFGSREFRLWRIRRGAGLSGDQSGAIPRSW